MATELDTKATIETLKLRAAAQVAKYPQYAGHFTGYRLARVKRDVRTKMGLAFKRGEFVIAVERDASHPHGSTLRSDFATAWSMLNACDTSIATKDMEWVS
jgi:hypothetical protein